MTQSIIENLWWVISGKLAGVRKPEAEELSDLETAGIGAIVSVFHEPSNLDLYNQVGLPYLWLPIEIDGVPTGEQIQEFQNFVNSQNLLGHGVAVHCSTGKHRTGTIIASSLILAGSSYKSAMKTILKANSDITLATSQINFLQDLELK